MEISVINDGYLTISESRDSGPVIQLGLNCYLIRSDSENILIDTGIGNNGLFDHSRYRPELPRKLLEGLKKNGLQPQNIGHVVLTHLHFDHFFGCFDRDGRTVFQKAKLYIQEKEVESYVSNEIWNDLIISLRNEKKTIFLNGDKELPAGVKIHFSGSHTPGFQYVSAVDGNGVEHIFPGDIVPTVWHLNNSNPDSIDHDTARLVADKRSILERCSKNSSVLYFQHSKSILSSRIFFEDGRFRLIRQKK
jgi:glyoxylase-like metal-dependent hydrolase (beta-lactamase superfamily II)